MLGILLLALLLLEVYVLGYLEFISWRTIYTPLCCLMFPYLLVLLISMAIAGHLGFVNFCYSSISVWCVGFLRHPKLSSLVGKVQISLDIRRESSRR